MCEIEFGDVLERDTTNESKCLCTRCVSWESRCVHNCVLCSRVLPRNFEQSRLYGGWCRGCTRVFDRKWRLIWKDVVRRDKKDEIK